jgi:hypothetical protein
MSGACPTILATFASSALGETLVKWRPLQREQVPLAELLAAVSLATDVGTVNRWISRFVRVTLDGLARAISLPVPLTDS